MEGLRDREMNKTKDGEDGEVGKAVGEDREMGRTVEGLGKEGVG